MRRDLRKFARPIRNRRSIKESIFDDNVYVPERDGDYEDDIRSADFDGLHLTGRERSEFRMDTRDFFREVASWAKTLKPDMTLARTIMRNPAWKAMVKDLDDYDYEHALSLVLFISQFLEVYAVDEEGYADYELLDMYKKLVKRML